MWPLVLVNTRMTRPPSGDPYAFRTIITIDIPAAEAGINLWGTSSGADPPEPDFLAL
jgi:hypothetical protein